MTNDTPSRLKAAPDSGQKPLVNATACEHCGGRGMIRIPGTWFLGGPLYDECPKCRPPIDLLRAAAVVSTDSGNSQ